MNYRFALSLVVGFLISMITASITAERTYNPHVTWGPNKEIKYNNTFIIISFIGGIGIGYLLTEPKKRK